MKEPRTLRTQNLMQTQEPTRTQHPQRIQDFMRTQDRTRTKDSTRTQDGMRNQNHMRTEDCMSIQDPMRYEDPRPYEDSKFFNDPGKTQELSNFLISYLISLNTFHITGVDKILSRVPIFRARNFTCSQLRPIDTQKNECPKPKSTSNRDAT